MRDRLHFSCHSVVWYYSAIRNIWFICMYAYVCVMWNFKLIILGDCVGMLFVMYYVVLFVVSQLLSKCIPPSKKYAFAINNLCSLINSKTIILISICLWHYKFYFARTIFLCLFSGLFYLPSLIRSFFTSTSGCPRDFHINHPQCRFNVGPTSQTVAQH